MEILGVGPWEFLLIVIIVLLILGPKEMIITARKIGLFIRKVVRSPIWAQIMDTSREIRELPKKMMDEVSIENDIEALKKEAQSTLDEIKQIGDEMKISKEDLTPKFQAPSTSVPISGKPNTPGAGLEMTPASEIEMVESPAVPADPEELPVFDPFIAAGIDPPPAPTTAFQPEESLPEPTSAAAFEEKTEFVEDTWKPVNDPLAAAAGDD